jgi:hypothetical protein
MYFFSDTLRNARVNLQFPKSHCWNFNVVRHLSSLGPTAIAGPTLAFFKHVEIDGVLHGACHLDIN